AQLYSTTTLNSPTADARLKAVVAEAQSYLGNLSQAEATAAEALKKDPKSVPARIVMTRLFAARGATEEALKTIGEVTVDDPKSTEAWHLRGDLNWVIKGDAAAAAEAYQKAVALDPS